MCACGAVGGLSKRSLQRWEGVLGVIRGGVAACCVWSLPLLLLLLSLLFLSLLLLLLLMARWSRWLLLPWWIRSADVRRILGARGSFLESSVGQEGGARA